MTSAATLVDRVHRAYQAAHYSEAAGLLPSVSHTIDVLIAEGPSDGRRDTLRLRASIAVAAAKLATKAGDALAGRLAAERRTKLRRLPRIRLAEPRRPTN